MILRMSLFHQLLGLICVFLPGAISAQDTTGIQASRAEAALLEQRLPQATVGREAPVSYELTLDQETRMRRWLPELLQRLQRQEEVNVLVIGGTQDLAVAVERDALGAQESELASFPAQFVSELAARFQYTGGVVKMGQKVRTLSGASITLRTLRAEHGVLDFSAILASRARQAPVQLVIFCCGVTEAHAGISAAVFNRALDSALTAAKELGAERVLCSPWLPWSVRPELSLGHTAQLAGELKAVAASHPSVFLADMTDWSTLFELCLDDARTPSDGFARLGAVYGAFFQRPVSAESWWLPKAELHRRLGRQLWQQLVQEAPVQSTWRPLEKIQAQRRADVPDELELKAELVAAGPAGLPQSVCLPLATPGWKPTARNAVDAWSSRGGEAHCALSWHYQKRPQSPVATASAPGSFPVLLVCGQRAQVQVLRPAVQPLTVLWEAETQFNVEGRLLLRGKVCNASADSLRGQWQAEFAGQTRSSSLAVAADSSFLLDLDFTPPTAAAGSAPVTLTLTVGSQQWKEVRQLHWRRNLGLKIPVECLSVPSESGVGKVTASCLADAQQLALTLTLEGLKDLQSWQLDLHLDARSYGKRLTAGSTAVVRLSGGAPGQEIQIQPLEPWAFGTGYAAQFDRRELKASFRAQGSTGQPELRLFLPRKFFYLHEWALDNGNSQLGINACLKSLHGQAEPTTWWLRPAAVSQQVDVSQLAVLELTEKPTPRMTVWLE
jgi:hypothetical protein